MVVVAQTLHFLFSPVLGLWKQSFIWLYILYSRRAVSYWSHWVRKKSIFGLCIHLEKICVCACVKNKYISYIYMKTFFSFPLRLGFLSVLELTLKARLTSNSQTSAYLCLLCAEIKGHHCLAKSNIFKRKKFVKILFTFQVYNFICVMNIKRYCGAAERKKSHGGSVGGKIKRLTVISEPSSSPHLILGGGYSCFMRERLLFY